jgi:preprotein translocase subunit SecE
MATETNKQVHKSKPAQTVRERSQTSAKVKKRRLHATAGKLAKVAKLTKTGLGMIFSPFKFVLKPFKLRPVRFIGRILSIVLFIGYFRGSWQELRKVNWPDRRTTVRLTLAVFVFATVFGLVISVVDFGLDKLFKAILIK